MLSWESITPFALPVVPLVCVIKTGESDETSSLLFSICSTFIKSFHIITSEGMVHLFFNPYKSLVIPFNESLGETATIVLTFSPFSDSLTCFAPKSRQTTKSEWVSLTIRINSSFPNLGSIILTIAPILANA